MEKPLSAVFITEVSSVTAPMLARWANRGHRIAAVVVPGPRAGKRFSFSVMRRRLRRRLALRSHLGHAVPPLIEFSPPYDWDALGRVLGMLGADLLVCFGYGKLIPQTALELFPNGGLNLHPALLPHYRGPNPIHRLVIDQMHEAHGGVTLHKMTSGFDEGDILAQVGFEAEDWRSAATVNRALADAMAVLAADIAPEFCRGRLAGSPQPDGAYLWARIEPGPLIVGTQSSSEHVRPAMPDRRVECSGQRGDKWKAGPVGSADPSPGTTQRRSGEMPMGTGGVRLRRRARPPSGLQQAVPAVVAMAVETPPDPARTAILRHPAFRREGLNAS